MSILKNFPSSDYIAQNAAATFLRFPFTLLSSVIATSFAVYMIEHESFSTNLVAQKMILVASLGLPLFTALAVFAERKARPRVQSYLVQFGGVIILTLYYFSLPESIEGPEMIGIRYVLLVTGLHFLVAFLPYLGKGQVENFWQYNKSLFLRFLTAALYSAVLYIGLAIALAAADYLFGMDIKETRYFQLWVIIAGFFQTLVFLSGIPDKLDFSGVDIAYPKGLKIFTQYILLPLVGLYFVILIAYEAKIIIQWNWPKGWVSQLVLWYSVVGILSLLLLHPLRDKTENKWIQVFSKRFFYALLPLVVMLVLAIIRRISDYGVTESRYVVIALSVGLSITVLYFIFSKAKDIRIIPIILCLLAFLSAYGPWSAFAISKASQRGRLESFLIKNNLIDNGRIIPTQEEVSFDDRREISSIAHYLSTRHGKGAFDGIFSDSVTAILDTIAPYSVASKVTEMLGFEYVYDWRTSAGNQQYFYINIETGRSFEIAGYDDLYELNLQVYNAIDSRIYIGSEPYMYSLDTAAAVFYLNRGSDSTALIGENIPGIPLEEPVGEMLIRSDKNKMPVEEMTFLLSGSDFEAKIIIETINGVNKDDHLNINTMSAWIMVRKK